MGPKGACPGVLQNGVGVKQGSVYELVTALRGMGTLEERSDGSVTLGIAGRLLAGREGGGYLMPGKGYLNVPGGNEG